MSNYRVLGWSEREWRIKDLRTVLAHYTGQRNQSGRKAELLEKLRQLVEKTRLIESARFDKLDRVFQLIMRTDVEDIPMIPDKQTLIRDIDRWTNPLWICLTVRCSPSLDQSA